MLKLMPPYNHTSSRTMMAHNTRRLLNIRVHVQRLVFGRVIPLQSSSFLSLASSGIQLQKLPPTPPRKNFSSASSLLDEHQPSFKDEVPEKHKITLLDADGNTVFSPFIDPDFEITADALSKELQQAVDKHVYWACVSPRTISRNRHPARHYKLDSRKSLKKSKKRALRQELVVTPFVLIGAYQTLLQRAQQYPFGTNQKQDVAGHNIRNASIRFDSFEQMALKLQQLDGEKPDIVKSKKANTNVCNLILKEAMAMVMNPIVSPFLPKHSWYMTCTNKDKPKEEWLLPPNDCTARVEALARQEVDKDIFDKSTLFIWDLTAATGSLELNALQIKAIVNIATPYVAPWWPTYLFQLLNIHGQGPKKKRKWQLTEDTYSSLPSLLVDLLLMKLDVSEQLRRNPAFAKNKQARLSDRKKQKLGVTKAEGVPASLEKLDYVHVEYIRWGPTICVVYAGPEKLGEKLCKAVALELKSMLQFDRKLVDSLSFSQKKVARLTRKQREELKKAEKDYAKQEERVEIANLGTKKAAR